MLMRAGPVLLLLLPALGESGAAGRAEGAASSQQKEIQISGHAGWGGIAAKGDWAPVLVDVDNRGDKDRDLVLALTWAFPGSNQPSESPSLGGLQGRSGPTHHVPVTVAARARKRVSVTMLAPDQDRMSAWVYALPASGGRALAAAELATRPVEPGHRFLAVVGTDLPDGLPVASNDIARVLPEALPQDWRGYAGLDALLWLDGRPSEIHLAAADALRTWISSGGRLVVARSTEAGLPGSALADLLPVAPKGTVAIDGLELGPGKAEGRVSVLDSSVRSGKVLARQGNIPLVVDAPLDGGRVTYLAFDPAAKPFAGWPHAPRFWTSILGTPAPPRSDDNPNQMRAPRILGSTGLAQVAGRFPDVEPPAIGWLFVLIIAYLVVVGPLDYFVLRAFRRLELTWITFPAYVVGFTLFILVAGGAFMGRAAYQRELAVIDHHLDSGFARRRALSAVLAPTDLVYSIRDAEPLSSNFTSRSLFQDFSDKLPEVRMLHGSELSAQGWVLNRSFTGLAHSDRCAKAASPVTWKVEGPPQARAQVTVQNAGPLTYTEARLVTPSGVFELGTLPPGTRTIDAGRLFERPEQFAHAEGQNQARANEYGGYGNEGQISEPELNGRVRGQLIHLSFGNTASEGLTGFARGLEARRHVESGGSVLVAWSQSGDPEVRFDPFPNRRSGFQMTRFFRGPEK